MGGLKPYIASIPKTEIHLHVEACVSSVSYHQLMDKYDIPHDSKSDKLIDFSKIKSLKSMLESFYFVQSFFREPADFLFVAKDVVEYARRNNIYYIEAFASPSMVLNRGLISFDGMFENLIAGFDDARKNVGVDVRLIVDVSRSFGLENAMKNLDLLIAFLKRTRIDTILGIGLGGQEIGHPCADYEAVFAKARNEGLHVVSHAGEEVGPESIWDAIKLLHSERIGHGTSAIMDPALMEHLKETQLPLEICPTSNVITKKYVKRYSKHPIRALFDYGINVTVNTDDPVLFSVDLNDEYDNVATELEFSQAEINQLIRNNLMATFMPEKAKQARLKKLNKQLLD
ncbi:MAG: adenosine deaminase [Spirochaetales bacterium]|nr:adenosine deaminase [Spirochaetales bacterium]